MKPGRRRRPQRTAVRARAAWIADACIAEELRLLTRRVTNMHNRELRPHGLTIGHMNILVVASRVHPATQQQVSYVLHLEKCTLSRDVGPMCDRGWLIRRRDDVRACSRV